MELIYMDHSATTPVDSQVVEAMLPYFSEKFGNSSSLHSFGQDAAEALSMARQKIAESIGAKEHEIIFTSGGTESDNLAILGTIAAIADKKCHIITSTIEHPAVINTCMHLENIGHEVTYVSVDNDGIIDLVELESAIKENTSLISVMHANNEIGTIQPIAKIAEIAKSRGIYFHTDAVQSLGKIPVNVNDLGIDLLSISSHKIHGPKGVGVLYVRDGTKISPITFGGGHEHGLRSGTENIPGIVGLSIALDLATTRYDEDSRHMLKLRDSLIEKVFASIDDVHLNGHAVKRLPNNVNLSFRSVEGESLLMMLDLKGIAVSTGSACSSSSLKASRVLSSIGLSSDYIHGSLRISLGRDNTIEEIDYLASSLREIVSKLRAISAL
jgi:cysteine desulfurase